MGPHWRLCKVVLVVFIVKVLSCLLYYCKTLPMSYIIKRSIHLIYRLFVMNHHRRSAQVWHAFSVLPAHPHVRPQSEWAIPAFAFPAGILPLVLIYQPRRDGRLSRPWCEVAQAEIRTCNLPVANPALYHTATSAPYDQRIILFWKRALNKYCFFC